MSKYGDDKLQRVNLIFEPTKDAAVVDLDVVLKITQCETAAEVRAKIMKLEPGIHVSSLPEGGLANLAFRFLAHDPPSDTFGVVSRAQESDRDFPVLRAGFAVKNERGGWDLLIRGSGVLARAGALDPEQAEILRGELDRVHGGGGETKGGSGGTPGGADVVGEVADILEDLHEQRNEQGEQRERRVPACPYMWEQDSRPNRCVLVNCAHPMGGARGIVPLGECGPGPPDGVRLGGVPFNCPYGFVSVT